MKVLKTGEMPNGTAIQLEDWREDYPTVWDTVSIGAYPIAKNTGKWGGKYYLPITNPQE